MRLLGAAALPPLGTWMLASAPGAGGAVQLYWYLAAVAALAVLSAASARRICRLRVRRRDRQQRATYWRGY